MPAHFDVWLFIAGLGLFLLGMDQLERAVHSLAGDSFRGMLRRATGRPLASIFLGIFATALLQSSSILGLMVLAFVGASILPMRNAIGVVFGSNVGSTATGWLVAIIGFNVNLDEMALPFVGIGALGVVFAPAESRSRAWGALLLALGLLFLGMENMVAAADAFARSADPSVFAGHHPLVFLLVGLVVTVIVSTSAATILMTLSAMNAGLIGLEQAAAIVIGANIGTTSTMAMASLKGVAAKKQVALCHVLFNVGTGVPAFLLLLPHVGAITGFYGIDDPLVAVAAFHTTFNVMGVLLFYPFIPRLGDFLERRFQGGDESVSLYLSRVPTAEKVVALAALEKELRSLYRQVLALNLRALKVEVPAVLAPESRPSPRGRLEAIFGQHTTFGEDYETIKRLEGEVLDFVRRLQVLILDDAESRRLSMLLIATREAVQAAKAIKDVRENLVEFRHSGNPWLQEHVDRYNTAVSGFHGALADILLRDHNDAVVRETLAQLAVSEAELHEAMKQRTYAEDARSGLSGLELSTVLNVLHEVHAANKALLRGSRGLLTGEIPA